MRKFIIAALILISVISCNSKKTDNAEVTANTNAVNTNNAKNNTKLTSVINTNTLEINTKEYEGYATNIYYNASSAEEYAQAIADFNLIKDKASLDEWQSKYTDETPIMFAINYYPTEEKAIEIINYGADVNERTADFVKMTPLMSASRSGYLKLLKELIKNNADVNAKDYDGLDALLHAIDCATDDNEVSILIFKELINAGAKVNNIYIGDEGGDFSILDILMDSNNIMDSKLNFEIFKLLTENGADIKRVNENGTPVIANVIRKTYRIDIVKYLVSKGIDPKMKYTENGISYSLLSDTVYDESTEIAKYLIEQGADVNVPAYSKERSLMIEAIDNDISVENTELVKLLIENGADTSAVNEEGKTVFDIAREKGYDDILALENK